MPVADPHRTKLYHPERSSHRLTGERPQSPNLWREAAVDGGEDPRIDGGGATRAPVWAVSWRGMLGDGGVTRMCPRGLGDAETVAG